MLEMFRILRARIKAFLKRRELERDLDEEIAFHLAEKRRELEVAGAPAEEVEFAVLRRFGNASLTRERSRDAWIFGSVENAIRDGKYAARVLTKARAFSVIAVLTLAFGIGAKRRSFRWWSRSCSRRCHTRNRASFIKSRKSRRTEPGGFR
jgi:hypothetical protein